METKAVDLAVLDIMLKRFMDDAKGQSVPGNIFRPEQLDFQAFMACLEIQCTQTCPENYIDLTNVGDTEYCIK